MAALTGVIELARGPHRVISIVFLVAGTAIGFVVGRNLARGLGEWADDAPVISESERGAVVAPRTSPLAAAALVAVGIVAISIPLFRRVPTPIPGGLAAVAVQAWLQARAVADVGRRRGGRVLRPVGKLSFEGEELRLLPDPAGER
jgi:hypothetical protein